MSLKTSHSDANVVVEEALTVTYSQSVIQGSWGYTSANVSGYYTTMREIHRYARKSFRYVGMTYAAAKVCRAAMVAKFARDVKTSYWNADTMGGAWSEDTGGTVPMADVSLVHDEGDAWSVHVRVSEDDVRFRKVTEAYAYAVIFAAERQRGYGTDGEGAADEKEAT
mgnify:CR=1 FL=1